MTELTPASMAERQLDRLAAIARDGLDPAYDNADDWLCDFYPNFPWDEEGFMESVRAALASPRFPAIRDGVLARIGFDIGEELREALAEAEAGGPDPADA